MVPSSSPLARDDGLGSLKGQQGKVPLHLDNNLDQDFSSSEIFQESLVQFAHDTWAFGRAEASISLQYDAKVVEHVYQHELGGGQRDPPARSLALLELSMYLEKYLWPFYKPKSMGPSYFMSIMLMVNEKAREGSPTWTCFHGRKDDFPSFLAEALSLPMSFKLTYIERITFLNFVSNAFQSLEDTMVCGEVLRLVGLPLWHALSPGRLQLELHEHPTLVKHWKSLLKREAKLQGEPKEGQWLKLCQKHLGANFLPVLLTEFLTVLETEDVLSSETTRKYCEFFVSFLSTLLSQLPTRRFLHAVLDDQAVWIRCHGSQLYGHPSGKNFVKLVDKMQSLLIFPIDDHTGDAINDDVGVSLHHERVLRLQRLMYKYWPQLREASLVNCGQLARGNVLKKYLLSLAEKDLFRLVVKQLRLVSEDVANNKDSDFLVNVMLVAFERHKSQKEVIQSMPLYPTEKILLDDEAIPPDGIQTALTSGILALPTLNLQFLSMMDYLVRNFLLFQLESAFEIREDIADAVRRTSPYVGDDGAINYSGWSRMALQINSFSIREVKQPRIGETCPASVTADLVIDTHSLRADIAAEWDQLKEHDVLFFLRFDVQNLSNRTTVDWKGPKGRALHSSGLQYVRGAEIIEIRDAGKC